MRGARDTSVDETFMLPPDGCPRRANGSGNAGVNAAAARCGPAIGGDDAKDDPDGALPGSEWPDRKGRGVAVGHAADADPDAPDIMLAPRPGAGRPNAGCGAGAAAPAMRMSRGTAGCAGNVVNGAFAGDRWPGWKDNDGASAGRTGGSAGNAPGMPPSNDDAECVGEDGHAEGDIVPARGAPVMDVAAGNALSGALPTSGRRGTKGRTIAAAPDEGA